MNSSSPSPPEGRRYHEAVPPEQAELWTKADMAPHGRRFWLILALVLAGLGLLCVPISLSAWTSGESTWTVVGPLAAALVWFALAGLSLMMRRSRSLQGEGAPRSIIAAHRDHIMLAATLRIPYRDLSGLRITWESAQPRRRAIRPGARIADAMITSSLARTGHPGLLEITLEVPSHRVNSSLPAGFTMIQVASAAQGSPRVRIVCHPLFVTGDMVGMHRILADRAQEAGVPQLAG